jgi:hypothetical protein
MQLQVVQQKCQWLMLKIMQQILDNQRSAYFKKVCFAEIKDFFSVTQREK